MSDNVVLHIYPSGASARADLFRLMGEWGTPPLLKQAHAAPGGSLAGIRAEMLRIHGPVEAWQESPDLQYFLVTALMRVIDDNPARIVWENDNA